MHWILNRSPLVVNFPGKKEKSQRIASLAQQCFDYRELYGWDYLPGCWNNSSGEHKNFRVYLQTHFQRWNNTSSIILTFPPSNSFLPVLEYSFHAHLPPVFLSCNFFSRVFSPPPQNQTIYVSSFFRRFKLRADFAHRHQFYVIFCRDSWPSFSSENVLKYGFHEGFFKDG